MHRYTILLLVALLPALLSAHPTNDRKEKTYEVSKKQYLKKRNYDLQHSANTGGKVNLEVDTEEDDEDEEDGGANSRSKRSEMPREFQASAREMEMIQDRHQTARKSLAKGGDVAEQKPVAAEVDLDRRHSAAAAAAAAFAPDRFQNFKARQTPFVPSASYGGRRRRSPQYFTPEGFGLSAQEAREREEARRAEEAMRHHVMASFTHNVNRAFGQAPAPAAAPVPSQFGARHSAAAAAAAAFAPGHVGSSGPRTSFDPSYGK